MDFCTGNLSGLVYVFLYVLIAGMTSDSHCTALRCIKKHWLSLLKGQFLSKYNNNMLNPCINKYWFQTHYDQSVSFRNPRK